MLFRYLFFSAILIGLCYFSYAESRIPYTVPNTPWPEKFGNHRAVLKIEDASEKVYLNFVWRRHDLQPERRRLLIVNSITGDTIQNIKRLEVNNEYCELIFGPVHQPGVYYFYYLPYPVQEGHGFFQNDYEKPELSPSDTWISTSSKNNLALLPKARVLEIQSRTQFDSFYPMEVIPLLTEKEFFLKSYPGDYLLFSEDRDQPIRMLDEIPLIWLDRIPGNRFKGIALQNEYYVFQVGVFAVKKDLQNIEVEFYDLEGANQSISKDQFTCFNTSGIDPYGNSFEIDLDIRQDHIQALWIGIDVPETITPGFYKGKVKIKPENADSQMVPIEIEIINEVIPDRGDSELWRHSRLRWLNSTLGLSDDPVAPYTPINKNGEALFDILGRSIQFDQEGLPEKIKSNDSELLHSPISFKVVSGDKQVKTNKMVLKDTPGIHTTGYENEYSEYRMDSKVTIESDGYIHYKITIHPKQDFKAPNVRLIIPVSHDSGGYFMGMGLPGSETPDNYQWKWEGPTDSFWIGNTEVGLFCELRGGDYHGPLLNLFHPEPPKSWFNDNKGGFTLVNKLNHFEAVVYTGEMSFQKGNPIEFEFSFLITPVKELNPKSQFLDRYYHAGGMSPSIDDIEDGVRIFNVHHANEYNPYINYPFIANQKLSGLVEKMHEKGVKVKIYYTIRELSNHVEEIWALRSLGEEIFGNGIGYGFPWLREHLLYRYRPQWYHHFPNGDVDASIVNAPNVNRWYNYYIEGLAWLVENIDIDGLYLDDVSYDRNILKRMRNAMDGVKKGCIIDLHSNTGFSKGPATQYMEFFPYVDKLWFGESFMYNEMDPANWLVEVSGIPYGLMGDMLHGGGNPWRGMIYGMTVRYPWSTEGVYCDPRDIWKVWDDFGIDESSMNGYWESNPIVRTTNPEVLATSYIRGEKLLISLASWADKPVDVKLIVDWDRTNIKPENIHFRAPDIKGFQDSKIFELDEMINVLPQKGWLLLIE